MRTFVFVPLLGLAAASPTFSESATCLVDSGEAVDSATNAALFVWAATKRCAKSSNSPVKCEIDVASAVKSVTSMVDVILESVSKCGELNIKNKDCVLQAYQLSTHTAAIAAAIGEAYDKCNSTETVKPTSSPVKCTIDLKGSAKGLFKVTKQLTEGLKCHGGEKECAADVLNLAGALAGMGEHVAGSVGQCNRTTALNPNATAAPEGELCAQAVTALVSDLTDIAQDGMELAEKCAPHVINGPNGHPVVIEVEVTPKPTARLFEQEDEEDTGSSSSMNLVLGAFLPVTAVMGFAGGRFYGTRDPRSARFAIASAEETI